jgi:hypothetical protein
LGGSFRSSYIVGRLWLVVGLLFSKQAGAKALAQTQKKIKKKIKKIKKKN